MANGGSDNVSVLLNQGDGTFAADALYGAGDAPESVALGDLDGDGDLDLAVANYYSHNVKLLLNLTIVRGDLNCNGGIDFDDINPFVLALSDPLGYAAQYPNCNVRNADCNGDGLVDFDDINRFVELLSGG